MGDRYVMERMREGGFNLGGEQSGHIILSDFSTTGDGLMAALQVLAVLVETGKPMSALARQFEPVPQKLENVRFAGGKPLEDDEVKAAIADAEARLNGSGRLLVRASGTEPLIRIMAEGDDAKLVNAGGRGDRRGGEGGGLNGRRAMTPTPLLTRITALAPGMALSLAVAAVAMGLQSFETQVFDRIWLEGLVLAILIGAGVRTFWPPPETFRAGVAFSAGFLLEVAVVLLGASLSAPALRGHGAGAAARASCWWSLWA